MMRPANVVTSVADVLAGAAIAGAFSAEVFQIHIQGIIILCISTACLYGGGIVFNDVFDADLDKIERPERAIPSGKVSLQQASIFGSVFLLTGIIAAALVSQVSGLLA